MRTFILGAGASHGYKGSVTGVKPPLAAGFFDAYNGLEISTHRWVLVGSIVNYVKETRGVDPINFGSWNENIESFLTEIEDAVAAADWSDRRSSPEGLWMSRAYNEMVFLFASVLNEIQNGSVCGCYKRFVNQLGADDVVATFNWDCLLDRALWDEGNWLPDDGYGVAFRSVYENAWRESGGAPGNTSRKLLKLHGSTNWLMPYRYFDAQTGERKWLYESEDSEPPPVYCFLQSDGPYKTYQNRTKTGYSPYSYYYYPPNLPLELKPRPGYTRIRKVLAPGLPDQGHTVMDDREVFSMPLIVPPVQRKEYGIMGGMLDRLWDETEDAIVACDELVVAGYSFPATDRRAWDLMKNAIERRDRRLEVVVVDPYPEGVLARLHQELGDEITVRVRVQPLSDALDDGL